MTKTCGLDIVSQQIYKLLFYKRKEIDIKTKINKIYLKFFISNSTYILKAQSDTVIFAVQYTRNLGKCVNGLPRCYQKLPLIKHLLLRTSALAKIEKVYLQKKMLGAYQLIVFGIIAYDVIFPLWNFQLQSSVFFRNTLFAMVQLFIKFHFVEFWLFQIHITAIT